MSPEPANLSIVVIGASGDLALKKILPAFFALYCQDLLPPRVNIFGFARSKFTDEEFRHHAEKRLTCRYTPGVACADRTREFLERCFYVQGSYDSKESFLDLYETMKRVEGGAPANRLFFMAIPPGVVLDAARALGNSGLIGCEQREPWSRVVIEKPFGRDRESSDLLARSLADFLPEERTCRIDHYLGKEMIQNLVVLRFANLVFETVWNKNFIRNVQICWKEDIGVEERGGYFDSYGIIRDVMQNHILQILALVAMEPPVRFNADHVRDEKVKVLRSIPALKLEDVVLGQYVGSRNSARAFPAYVEEPTVARDSVTPTFAAAVLKINTARWLGVPFYLSAGKGLDSRMTEIRIQFKEVPNNMFCEIGGCPATNELVIRIQPDEAIGLKIVNKVPGLDLTLEARDLDLHYRTAFSRQIPEAYENLLLDVIKGDKSLFIRNDELEAAWDIFTPVLHEIDRLRVKPEPYPFLSRGPVAANNLAAKYGVACESA